MPKTVKDVSNTAELFNKKIFKDYTYGKLIREFNITTPDFLKKIRQEISYSFDEFNGIISSKKFQKLFPTGIQGQSKLKRFTDFPEKREEVVELLKMKGFCTKEAISDSVLTSDDAVKTIINYFKITKPLIDYLNKAIEFEE